MRRLLILGIVLASLAACAYDPGPVRPGVSGVTGLTGATGDTGASATGTTAPTGPTGTAPTFTVEGCPVDDPAFCEQAAFLANALVLGDTEAVLQRSRPERFDCRDLDAALFPQCSERERLKGYLIGTYQGELFVQAPGPFEDTLAFFVESVDPEYRDDLGGSAMRILGVSTCGSGEDTSHHVVYLVGLKDPESTLPGDRFLGTYEFVRREGTWVIGTTHVGLFTDWQLVLDEPLEQIACADVQPWG
jgi:hypothetical protein